MRLLLGKSGSAWRVSLAGFGLVWALLSAGGCSGQPAQPAQPAIPTGPQVTPFLMFEGKAEAAMNFYVSLFKDGKILRVERYGPGELGPEGTIKVATFFVGRQEIMCSDSPVQHGFTFTASTSLFVNCATEGELDALYKQLSEKGQVFMPLDAYPFSRKFGWVADPFGVSWQLNLPKE